MRNVFTYFLLFLAGLLLQSSDDVCVIYGRQRGDRSQLYPTDAFGTDYVIMTPSTTINVSSTVFVMPQGVPGVLTNVTLTVSSNSSLCELFTCDYGNTEFNFTIKSNEVLMLEDGNLMDGVRLNADRPVGVLVGGITTDDPRNGTVCLEPTISTTEMLPPINTWGKMFVAVPLTPEIPVTLKITGERKLTFFFARVRYVCLFVCLFGLYGISTFVGYLMPNPFLYKSTILFQIISTQFNSQKHLYFKLFNLVKQF